MLFIPHHTDAQVDTTGGNLSDREATVDIGAGAQERLRADDEHAGPEEGLARIEVEHRTAHGLVMARCGGLGRKADGKCGREKEGGTGSKAPEFHGDRSRFPL